jgi:hypothetical protein
MVRWVSFAVTHRVLMRFAKLRLMHPTDLGFRVKLGVASLAASLTVFRRENRSGGRAGSKVAEEIVDTNGDEQQWPAFQQKVKGSGDVLVDQKNRTQYDS